MYTHDASSRPLAPSASAVFIAKCSKCKIRSELAVCAICDEAKYKKCVDRHLMEAQEKWDDIEESLTTITNYLEGEGVRVRVWVRVWVRVGGVRVRVRVRVSSQEYSKLLTMIVSNLA